jgi:hypothetical protein
MNQEERDAEYWECPVCKWTFHRLNREHDCADYKPIAFYRSRIAELEADRDRLCEIVLRNPCRVALKTLLTRLDEVHADSRYMSVWMLYAAHGGRYTEPTYTAELEAARKALADTEHEVRKPHG